MDGILVVDKPKGLTSHDIVDFIRKKFELKKVGHAGTLDPMATGALVILLGGFTKLSGSFINDDKEYEATLILGATSDTGDACGKIVDSKKSINFKTDVIEDTFKKFLGRIEQTPPIYSAVKFKGKKLYEYARRGINVKRSPRNVFIRNLDILKIRLPEVFFKVTCSKGTYVRQLSADIGEELGCGAYLSNLRRLRSGQFLIEDALGFNELKELKTIDLEKKLRRIKL